MVKKKAPPKKAAKKAAPKRAAKKAKAAKKTAGFNGAKNRAAKSGRSRRNSEEQMELMPGTRYADLDRLCKNIGDTRDDINQLKGEDADLCTKALKAMRVHGVTAYKGSGVLLSIIPGDEKLLVKKDRTRSGAADGGQVDKTGDAPAGDNEPGAGQDAGAIADALTEQDVDE